MRRESNLRGTMTRVLRAMGYIAQPIESGETGLGIPDLYVRTSKASAWIELKNFRYALVYPVHVPFRPKQKEWLEDHSALGGMSVLVISEPKGVHVFVGSYIKKVYPLPLDTCSSLSMKKFSGKMFVDLLDELVGGKHESDQAVPQEAGSGYGMADK